MTRLDFILGNYTLTRNTKKESKLKNSHVIEEILGQILTPNKTLKTSKKYRF